MEYGPGTIIDRGFGAVASFLGVVRDHSRGGIKDGPYLTVTHLHYQCYRPMAEHILTTMVEEIAKEYDPAMSAVVIHGIGDHVPGEVSLAIHIACAHRAAAFAACRQVIEQIKLDLPVWKHERYADGSERWIEGA